ncbi:hypothetical protein BYT27DRAFT_7341790 [Phlegmacium glaucopus]|nr:hypothetical protein BYT27DRAFT_7341790 [Phlegmacium glaucopus]
MSLLLLICRCITSTSPLYLLQLSAEAMIPFLPLDIIGNIVDILANDNEKSLQYVKALSLTCQSFLPLCRTHILSSITITTSDAIVGLHHDGGEAFGEFLSTTPEIARYVRKLCIRAYDLRSQPGHLFVQVPRQLTRLESFTTLEHCPIPIDWNYISLSMRHLLLDFIHIPTLNHLDLRSLKNFPISHLIPSPNLKHLSTTNLFLDEADSVTALVPFKPIKLRVLDITLRYRSGHKMLPHQTPRFLAAIYSGRWPIVDLTGLEKISVKFPKTVMDLIIPLAQVFQNARQLTDVHFSVDDGGFRALKLAKMIMPCIETLSRMHLVIASNGLGLLPMSDLCDELEDIAGKNKLDSLKIKICIDRRYDILGDEQLGRLEKIFLKSGWPMLKHLSLDLAVANFGPPVWDDSSYEMAMEKVWQTQFTGLKSSKTMDFRFSVST